VYLVKREGAGTFSQTAPGPLSKALRAWLDEFSGGTNSLGRTNRDPAAPLILNGRPLSPGFRRYVPPSGDLFSGSDTEAYTWPEAGQLVHMRMRSDGQRWLLRVRLHWAAGLPIALQFTQTAHARDGSVIVGTSNVFQKRRGFSRTRIEKELSEDVSEERRCGVWLDLPGEGAEGTLVGTVLGPPGSPYHGGRFQLEITVPREYPFHAPRARFLTKIWHPNVDHRTGAVCLINIPPSLLLVKMLIHFQVTCSSLVHISQIRA
jgi:ubiquitin-protein ligase